MFSKRYMVVMRLGGCEYEQSRASTKYPLRSNKTLTMLTPEQKGQHVFFYVHVWEISRDNE